MESGALGSSYVPICVWVPNLLRRIAQLFGEAASMSLRELIVNENLTSMSTDIRNVPMLTTLEVSPFLSK
jgi:hypothetical protein